MENPKVLKAIQAFRHSLLMMQEAPPRKIELHPRTFDRLLKELYDQKIGTHYGTTTDQLNISITLFGMIIEPGEAKRI